LVVVGAAYVLVAMLGMSYPVAVATVVIVAFTYVFMGGTYAHAYTNVAQGILMLVAALAIFVQAVRGMGSPEGALDVLAAQDPNLVSWTNPASPFFRNFYEVALCPFVIGFAIVAQPHLLVKAQYVKSTRDVAIMSAAGAACFVVFSLALFS